MSEHATFKHHKSAVPFPCAVHCHFCVAKHVLRFFAFADSDGYTKDSRQVYLLFPYLEGRRDRFQNFFRKIDDLVVLTRGGQKQSKFVTADAAHGCIRGHHRFQPFTDIHYQCVTDRAAEAFIHYLEIFEIEH